MVPDVDYPTLVGYEGIYPAIEFTIYVHVYKYMLGAIWSQESMD